MKATTTSIRKYLIAHKQTCEQMLKEEKLSKKILDAVFRFKQEIERDLRAVKQ